jgi:outer membrane protein assembly factor BamB
VRLLVQRIHRHNRVFVLALFLGIPFTFGGVHFGVTRRPTGFLFALVGLVALGVGGAAFARVLRLRRSLRALTPDAWRSPVAQLPVARRAATLAAWLNGLLVVFGLGAAGWLLVMGADWGAYGNSFGFAALTLGAALPLGLGLAAASTIPQLLRVVPAGATVGQALYGVFVVVGSMMFFRNDDVLPKVVGGALVLVSLGAVKLLNGAARRMRGGSQPPAAAPPVVSPAPPAPAPAPGYGPAPWSPQPPAPARSGGRGLLTGVLALALVLLVTAGTGLYWAHHNGLLDRLLDGSDGTTADTAESPHARTYGIDGERRSAWATPLPKSGDGTSLLGTLADDHVVAGVYAGTVVGYDLATGKPAWTVRNEPGLHACAVSPSTSKGIGAVLYRMGDQGGCTQAVAVDLDSGKRLWKKTLTQDPNRAGAYRPAIGIEKNTVVTGTYSAPVALDARTGRTLWTGRTQRSADGGERRLDHVQLADGRLMASYEDDSDTSDAVILTQDLATGRVLDTLNAPPATKQNGTDFSVRLVHLHPLVVAVPKGVDAGNEELCFSRTKGAWRQLRIQDVRGEAARPQRYEGVAANGVFVKAWTIDDRTLDVGFDTVVAGFDLSTGKVAWQHRLRRDASEAVLFPDSVKGAVRAVASDDDTGLQLYAFPFGTGTPVRGGRLTLSPDSPLSATLTSMSYATETNGRLVVWNEAEGVLTAFPLASA